MNDILDYIDRQWECNGVLSGACSHRRYREEISGICNSDVICFINDLKSCTKDDCILRKERLNGSSALGNLMNKKSFNSCSLNYLREYNFE